MYFAPTLTSPVRPSRLVTRAAIAATDDLPLFSGLSRGRSLIVHAVRQRLKIEALGTIVHTMLKRAVLQRLLVALLAVSVFFSTAPVVQAALPTNPCDCPSMQTHDQGMTNHARPAQQKDVPCSDMQNCICSLSCGMSAGLSQQSLSLPSLGASNRLAWSEPTGGSGLSIKPSIPPPISVV